jgi:hypothetical protein
VLSSGIKAFRNLLRVFETCARHRIGAVRLRSSCYAAEADSLIAEAISAVVEATRSATFC